MVGGPGAAVRLAPAQRCHTADGGSPIWYGTILALQVLFYILAMGGYYLSARQIKNKLLFIPYYFLFMNINVMKGVNYLRKMKGTGAWEKAQRTKTESLNQ